MGYLYNPNPGDKPEVQFRSAEIEGKHIFWHKTPFSFQKSIGMVG